VNIRLVVSVGEWIGLCCGVGTGLCVAMFGSRGVQATPAEASGLFSSPTSLLEEGEGDGERIFRIPVRQRLYIRVLHLGATQLQLPPSERLHTQPNYKFIIIMAALCNRGHYIFALYGFFFFYLSFFFPRLISAVADWMSVILPHMVWP